ncbi:MAG TPA: DNA alkylation repair protein [Gemmatimonadaceae bacterium]|nr:DNA alkylation repair protein [Gemmatimonadaceae bacterium]
MATVKKRPAARSLAALRKRLRELGDAGDAEFLQRFFKTGPGQYGEGDRFLGIRVPVTRKLAHEFRDLPLDDIARLLHEPWHEARLLAVIMLSDAYARGTPAERAEIFRLYLDNAERVNNWDLVDASAPNIVGAHLATRSRTVLDKLARSKNLWERRIAVVANQHLIRLGEFDDTIRVAKVLLTDKHDLIHKAVGWMLREVGDRDASVLDGFLDEHAHEMPRTMLRYAIEKMQPAKRRRYMSARAERS